MKRVITFSISLLLFSCHKTEDISGHWHLTRDKPFDDFYMTMDISKDSVAFLGLNSIYGPIEGVHRPKNRQLLFPGDCGVFFYEYKVRGNKIYLENYLGNATAERCDSNCCNKVIDFKNDLRVKVLFPKIVNKRESLNPMNFAEKSFVENICIGIPKEPYDLDFETKPKLVLKEKFARIKDIGIWVESVRSQRNESIRDLINYRIIADENILVEDLKPLVNELKKNGIRRIFLSCLKENYEEEDNIFEYVFIENINLESEKTLKDILN